LRKLAGNAKMHRPLCSCTKWVGVEPAEEAFLDIGLDVGFMDVGV
jgi:hypothetical protein